ncbi:hypothetical protein HELRODRAFT_169012 [Helobdella robusta]|uniref:Catalase n=1 Tax=Helobdella robusta TaxID=6412 RepID=T1F193_HELRO|nr:hypothetical protein HELRODRAFT_169012 [Helobdella robusta]ESO09073.1 hypothetical protein HELRODRAFT_169012 [Helobdella robusta]
MADLTSQQLESYKQKKNCVVDELTTSLGVPIGSKTASMTAGPRGPLLVQDFVFHDEMAHFDRERIPERVVHAKGTGAHGYFEVTHDITKYCKAKVFEHVGKKTPVFVRFSTVAGEMGSADTVRDLRGFATKFYTEEGNWDIVGNNSPIFFIRDPILFPSLNHSQKRNPKTNLRDADMFWDFISLRPETTYQVCILFSDKGIPDGYRHMDGYGTNTFKLVNCRGEPVYCKFIHRTNQGIQNLTTSQAVKLAGEDPDYATKDLYNAIEQGLYPSWTTNIQVMTYQQAEKTSFNPFDVTKEWPAEEFPEMPYGRIVLNKNPQNHFAEVEQVAFSPAHLVPGIEPSPDKMLHGRLFSYSDTHRYRLGTNYNQLPVNCPYRARVSNYQRDGPQTFCNQGDAPNYFPNSFTGPDVQPIYFESRYCTTGDVSRYETRNDDNFSQATTFWEKELKADERERLVENIANHLKNAKEFIRRRAVYNFASVHEEFGRRLQAKLDQLCVPAVGLIKLGGRRA